MTMATSRRVDEPRHPCSQEGDLQNCKLSVKARAVFVLDNPGDTQLKDIILDTYGLRLSVVKHCTFLMHHLLDISPPFWNYWVVLICCFVLGACHQGTCRPSLLFIYVYYPSIGKSLESHFVGGPAHRCKISEVCSVCSSSKHMLSHNVCSDWILQISVDICSWTYRHPHVYPHWSRGTSQVQWRHGSRNHQVKPTDFGVNKVVDTRRVRQVQDSKRSWPNRCWVQHPRIYPVI